MAALTGLTATGAAAQRPVIVRHRLAPGARGAAAPRAIASPAQAAAIEGRRLLGLYLRLGVKQPHMGEQVTRLLQPGSPVRETRQIVKYAGPGRIRMEYAAPPDVRGETILITGGRFFHYRPAPQNRILEGVATTEQMQIRVRELLRGIRSGSVQVRAVGQELVAGHSASIVEIRSVAGGAFYLKFWIDPATGVRLRYENLDPRGGVVSESFFTNVTYAPTFAAADFQPAALPAVPHEALLPEAQPLPTVQAAQAQVGYPIREPALPQGFRLSGVWVVTGPSGRRTSILRYTDGVNTVALFETPLPNARPVSQPLRPPHMRNGVVHWTTGDLLLTLIGNLRPDAVRQAVDSVH